MNFLQALQCIITAEPNGAGIPALLVNNKEASRVLSTYVNMEGGLGYIYGPFPGADGLTIYEIDLRETAESPDEEPGADDNTCDE